MLKLNANFLASPMLVVVYALAGRVDLDFATEPVAYNDKNEPVFFKDLWPTNAEIHDLVKKTVTSEMFKSSYEKIYSANPQWDAVEVEEKDALQLGSKIHLCSGAVLILKA